MFGAAGLEGRNRAYAGAGGDPLQIAYSAYTYDLQGSLVQPVSLYPDNGPVVRVETSSSYDAFGAGGTVAAGGTGDPFSPVGFGGQHGYYRDYSGLYLLTHRYYDPGTGKFLNRDPSGYGGGMNLYGFADGNPVNESDPSGDDPHYMTMSVIRDGQVITKLRFASGSVQASTQAEKAFYARGGFPGQAATHTEARALAINAFEPGDKVIMEGSLESCRSCKGKLNAAAQRLGVAIEYRYPDAKGNIISWSAKSPATRSVLLRAAKRGALSNLFKKALLKSVFKVIVDDTLGKALFIWDIIPGQFYDGSIQRRMYWEQQHPHEQYREGACGA